MSSHRLVDSPTTPEFPSAAKLGSFGRSIEVWGSANRRDFPWRSTRDPWLILVAEVALQQTQAGRVAERFDQLASQLATPAITVAAGKAAVLGLWSGLGYNSRAVRLFEAAVCITSDHNGHMPTTARELQQLPGVGPYTAAAIEAFAFERDVAVYDTNVARVIARAVLGRPVTALVGRAVASQLVPKGKGWSFNQAVLDLGATICTARKPNCDQCPLKRRCAWRAVGLGSDDPAITTAGTARRQSRFEGSNRQGRGRIVAELRGGPKTSNELHDATGWDDQARTNEQLTHLVAEGVIGQRGQRFEIG